MAVSSLELRSEEGSWRAPLEFGDLLWPSLSAPLSKQELSKVAQEIWWKSGNDWVCWTIVVFVFKYAASPGGPAGWLFLLRGGGARVSAGALGVRHTRKELARFTAERGYRAGAPGRAEEKPLWTLLGLLQPCHQMHDCSQGCFLYFNSALLACFG